MDDVGFYTIGHPEYFETLGHVPIQSEYLDRLRENLPAEWAIARSDIWLSTRSPASTLPAEGFKIHLSSTLVSAKEMIRRFVPICVKTRTQFKIVADPVLHGYLNSKRYYRGGSGKFATIYPANHALFLELIEALHEATRGMEGPYILSDKRFRDSKVVFYRWGGFQRISTLRPDGVRRTMMHSPDGALVPDDRLPYFKLPEWVADPFPGNASESDDDDGPLHGRYVVEEAVAFTNTGGVYRARDEVTGLKVAIKEARPHTLIWGPKKAALDATAALMNEYAALRCLQGLSCVPQLVEFYEEWEHSFLVQTWFDGVPLASFRALEDTAVLGKMHDAEAVFRFCIMWRELCLRVLSAVNVIHQRGVIIGDISPGNVLINGDSLEIAFIDFEGALISNADEAIVRLGTQWANPGFRKAESRNAGALSHLDDWYSCGMLLYNLVCPIQALFELDPTQPIFRILDHFVHAGLPNEIRLVIRYLLEGHPDEARQEAENWNLNQSAQAEIAKRISEENQDFVCGSEV
jgi:hypothetical protein